MTDARVKDFFDKMVKAGRRQGDLDYKKTYTTEFVCKGSAWTSRSSAHFRVGPADAGPTASAYADRLG